ncbi:MAG: hypothetical protein DCC55_05070 [Chloroflexi bacterium]|nr:MAG: hypothetical protein DCC55_05070 [Chloroflexota bacterium]
MNTLLDTGSNQETGQPPAGGEEPGEICIANISPRERRKRLRFGIVTFVVGLAVLAALVVLGADRWWRLALFPLFWGAASGFFQWREKT